MDPQRAFITTLVDSGKFNEARRSGITSSFLDEDYAAIYNYVGRHYAQYRDVPSRGAILHSFPGFEFGKYREPLEFFIDTLKENYRRAVIDQRLAEIAEASERDTKKAEELLRDVLSDIQVTHKTFQDVSVNQTALSRIDAYRTRKSNPGADGILSGWGKIDYQTLGWHPEEFIVLVGEKYMGKSWKMIWLAYQAAMQGERVLYVTKEMSQEATVRRFDSIYAGVTFDKLRRGELTHQHEERFVQKMEELAKSNLHFMVARQGVNTIEDIEAKAVETDATIIFGDSIYLFPADSKSNFSGETAKRLASSQKCKEIAQRLGVPFLVSVQAGRKKSKNQEPSLDDIEWSNAFSQDADTVVFLTKEAIDRELKRAQLWLLKSRDGDLTKTFINTDFDYMRFDERDDEDQPTTDVFIEGEEDADEDEVIEFAQA